MTSEMGTEKTAELWRRILYSRPHKWFCAVRLAVALVRKPWDEKTDDPYDNIDIRTAWAVAYGLWLKD